MRLTYRPLFVLSACFGVCSAAFGSTRVAVTVFGGAFQEPGIQVTPNVIEVGKSITCPAGCSHDLSNPATGPLDAVADGGASFQTAIAVGHAAAHAEVGNLGINIQAGGSGGQNKAQGKATATASAEWRYAAPFIAPGLPDGAVLTIQSILILEGSMNGLTTGENSSIYGSFRIEDLSGSAGFPAAPYEGGTWGQIHALGGSQDVNDMVPGKIHYTRQVRNSLFNPIGFRFSLFGTAESDTVNGTSAATAGNAAITADASHSLRWGGIESVTDEFGNPVTDWTFIGENGFDFSKPFPVPEPTGIVTALGALLLTCSQRVGRR